MQTITASKDEVLKSLCLVFNSFLALAAGAVIINLHQEKIRFGRIIDLFIIIAIFLIAILMSSRIRGITCLVVALAAYQLIGRSGLPKIVTYAMILMSVTFLVITVVRQSGYVDRDRILQAGVPIQERLDVALKAFQDPLSSKKVEESFRVDYGYRVNAIEWPARMMRSMYLVSAPYMLGEDLFWSVYQGVPSFLTPFPKMDPKGVANEHYSLKSVDQNGTVFGTVIADWGIWGLLPCFGLIGFFHALIWRHFCSANASWAYRFVLFALIPVLMTFEIAFGTIFVHTLRYGLCFFGLMLAITFLLRFRFNAWNRKGRKLSMRSKILRNLDMHHQKEDISPNQP